MSDVVHPSTDPRQRHGYRGRPLAETESARGVYLRESTYDAGTHLPTHQHARGHLCFVLGGRYVESFGDERHVRTPGTLILYPPDIAHSELHESPGRHLIIDFDPVTTPGRTIPSTRPLAALPSPRSHVALHRLRRRLTGRDGCALVSLDETAETLIALSLDDGRAALRDAEPSWLRHLDPWIDHRWRQPPTLRMLAADLTMHPSHVARVLKRFRGRTLSAIVRQRKVRGAQEAIERGVYRGVDADLVGTALECGFCDQSHMNRAFRAEIGMTPGQYRRLVCAAARGPST